MIMDNVNLVNLHVRLVLAMKVYAALVGKVIIYQLRIV